MVIPINESPLILKLYKELNKHTGVWFTPLNVPSVPQFYFNFFVWYDLEIIGSVIYSLLICVWYKGCFMIPYSCSVHYITVGNYEKDQQKNLYPPLTTRKSFFYVIRWFIQNGLLIIPFGWARDFISRTLFKQPAGRQHS